LQWLKYDDKINAGRIQSKIPLINGGDEDDLATDMDEKREKNIRSMGM